MAKPNNSISYINDTDGIGHTIVPHMLTDGTYKIECGTQSADGYVITSNSIGSQSVNYANTAGSAPASDVYSWAKQSSKPSYTYSEVGAAAAIHTHGSSGIDYNASLTDDEGALAVNFGTTAGTAAEGNHTHSQYKTTWRPIKIGTTTVVDDGTSDLVFVPTDDITITKYGTNKIYIGRNGTCLIEGTQITLADGTTKNVEDIQPGEEILSYDPATASQTTAVAMEVYKTGTANEYLYTIFDDGSRLVTYGNHSVFSTALGYPKDITTWELGDTAYNQSGETIEKIDSGKIRYKGEYKNHYVLISSNNLYYANDILTCHWGSTKYKRLHETGVYDELPDAIKSVFDQEEHKYGDQAHWMISDDYISELKDLKKRKNALDKIIDDAKKNLTDTDYIGQKYIEGLITAAEWLKNKTQRATWRKLVNDNETEQATLATQIKAIKAKYKTPLTQRERYSEYVTMCNGIKDALIEYYKK